MDEIMDAIIDRNLGETLQLLLKATNSRDNKDGYRMNLVSYNTILSNWYKGLLTEESFNVQLKKVWNAVFYFIDRESPETIVQISQRLGIEAASGITSILFVAANPRGAEYQLQVDFEYRTITEAIKPGIQRDKLLLYPPLMAATLESFLLEKNNRLPVIIHFSGHGSPSSLEFASDSNTRISVPDTVLKEVFKGVGQYAQCIILNACYSGPQAKAISEQGVYVIGMNDAIGDKSSVFLSDKFYRALSDGQDIPSSFRQARLLMQQELAGRSRIPELWKNGSLETG